MKDVAFTELPCTRHRKFVLPLHLSLTRSHFLRGPFFVFILLSFAFSLKAFSWITTLLIAWALSNSLSLTPALSLFTFSCCVIAFDRIMALYWAKLKLNEPFRQKASAITIICSMINGVQRKQNHHRAHRKIPVA